MTFTIFYEFVRVQGVSPGKQENPNIVTMMATLTYYVADTVLIHAQSSEVAPEFYIGQVLELVCVPGQGGLN